MNFLIGKYYDEVLADLMYDGYTVSHKEDGDLLVKVSNSVTATVHFDEDGFCSNILY